MKTLFPSLTLSAAAVMATTQTALAQTTGMPDHDETAIKAVIDSEKAASDAADYKAYLNHWAKVPYASFLYQGQQFVGDVLWKTMDQVFANRKPGQFVKLSICSPA